ncbi:MAG: hypothetical protein QOG87_1202 [Actinomycetota bacterium]|jgi:hypothetical protein
MSGALLSPSVRDRTETAALRAAATFFAVAVLVHNGDHLRRGGDTVSAEVFALGSAAMLLEIGVVLLVFMRHPAAPLAAAGVGFQLALGYLAVHFTPERSWFSDSFVSGEGSALSWTAASLETAAALVLGVIGVVVLRRHGTRPAEGGKGTRAFAEGLRHPIVVAMVLGNLAIFLGSLATR